MSPLTGGAQGHVGASGFLSTSSCVLGQWKRDEHHTCCQKHDNKRETRHALGPWGFFCLLYSRARAEEASDSETPVRADEESPTSPLSSWGQGKDTLARRRASRQHHLSSSPHHGHLPPPAPAPRRCQGAQTSTHTHCARKPHPPVPGRAQGGARTSAPPQRYAPTWCQRDPWGPWASAHIRHQQGAPSSWVLTWTEPGPQTSAPAWQ